MAVVLPQSIQSDVQQALPVIPNNGNPAGAYNMPQAGQAVQGTAQAVPDPFAWLKPSVYMEEARNIMANWDRDVQAGIERLMMPQEKGQYNPAVRPDGMGYVPVTDDGLPLMSSQYQQAMGYPVSAEDAVIPLMVYDDSMYDVPQYVLPEM